MIAVIKRHRNLVVVLFLLGFAYVLFSRNLNRHPHLHWYDRTFLWIISPAQKAVTSVVDGFASVWNHYFFLVGLVEENADLRAQIAELEFKNEELIEEAIENERLRKLLLFRERIPEKKISAEVIALDLSSQFQMIRIDRGEKDGVKAGLAVLGAGGVVGQIFRSTQNYSDVLLGTDRNSSIDGVVQRSRARGIIVGEGRKTFKMDFKFLSRADDVKPGDLVITSGLDGVFPAGLSLGYITDVDKPDVGIFQYAKIQPTVDFAKIKEVIVILIENRPLLPGMKESLKNG